MTAKLNQEAVHISVAKSAGFCEHVLALYLIVERQMEAVYFRQGAVERTPPYGHPVYKTTSLLRPYSFKPNVKTSESFYYFEDPVNATTSLLRPGFYGPTVVA